MGYLILAYRADLPHRLLFFFPPASQLIHDPFIYFCMEKPAEDHLLLIGFCPEKLHKLPLSDHGHLHELAFGQAHDLLQFPIRLFLRVLCSVRHSQRH